MKNYQFIVITALLVGVAGYIYYINNSKKCSCQDELPEIAE